MSYLKTFVFALAGAFALSAAAPRAAEAQIFAKMKDAAKKKAEEATAKASAPTPQEKPAPVPAVVPVAPPSAATPIEKPAPETTTPALASTGNNGSSGRGKEWANYDFVPGSNVLFFTDFTDDQVGNFPRKLTFKRGAMEVVQLESGQRALKASSYSQIVISLPVVLPEKFTIEIGVINRNSNGVAASTVDIIGGTVLNDYKYTHAGWGHNGLGLSGGEIEGTMTTPRVDAYVGKPATFRILADGPALKLYADDKRLANIPNGNFRRDKLLTLDLQGRDDKDAAVYVTSIRVAESQKSIYDELKGRGRWATQGILFDVAKADVKGESTPTLKEIASALKEHPEIKVEIQGHTDNVGTAAANLKLSEERANAVKAVLTSEYGVSETQISAKGYGSTKPVAPNTTVEGRANNRRVELVKH
jgi:outer membrane protein OmpA-like peptidoglycan-associated protein